MKKLTQNWWKVALGVGLTIGLAASVSMATPGDDRSKKPKSTKPSSLSTVGHGLKADQQVVAAELTTESGVADDIKVSVTAVEPTEAQQKARAVKVENMSKRQPSLRTK